MVSMARGDAPEQSLRGADYDEYMRMVYEGGPVYSELSALSADRLVQTALSAAQAEEIRRHLGGYTMTVEERAALGMGDEGPVHESNPRYL